MANFGRRDPVPPSEFRTRSEGWGEPGRWCGTNLRRRGEARRLGARRGSRGRATRRCGGRSVDRSHARRLEQAGVPASARSHEPRRSRSQGDLRHDGAIPEGSSRRARSATASELRHRRDLSGDLQRDTGRVLLLFEKHLGLTGAAAGLARCGRRARRVTSVHADVRDRANVQPRGGRMRKAQRLGARRGSRARRPQGRPVAAEDAVSLPCTAMGTGTCECSLARTAQRPKPRS